MWIKCLRPSHSQIVDYVSLLVPFFKCFQMLNSLSASVQCAHHLLFIYLSLWNVSNNDPFQFVHFILRYLLKIFSHCEFYRFDSTTATTPLKCVCVCVTNSFLHLSSLHNRFHMKWFEMTAARILCAMRKASQTNNNQIYWRQNCVYVHANQFQSFCLNIDITHSLPLSLSIAKNNQIDMKPLLSINCYSWLFAGTMYAV